LIYFSANRAPGHHPTRPRLRPHLHVDQGHERLRRGHHRVYIVA
jgi:hypothetical protein